MATEKVFFVSGGHRLEGLYAPGAEEKGVVVTHPHPLYGGDMRNSVVATAAKAYQRCGYGTLRFNFRGVGLSKGHHDDGNGEQEDVRAAAGWMAAKGMTCLHLAGYSYGAWVNALTGGDFSAVRRMIMISPPVGFLDFSSVTALGSLGLVVTGDQDDIAPAGPVQAALAAWNPDARFEKIRGADHFFSGCLDRLEALLERFISSCET